MTARYMIGDVRAQLALLEPGSVDLVLSSPPFLALRSYLPADHPDKASEIGSEPTPGEFLDTILDVVEACARVLAPHGSLVFEFGDTYAGSGGNQPTNTAWRMHPDGSVKTPSDTRRAEGKNGARAVPYTSGNGWPLDKSLALIPESFAWALAYGRNPWTGRETEPWRIRNFCPWVRPNPPVGALGDKFRPATSYLTVATKARGRWFDLDAVRQPIAASTADRAEGARRLTGKSKDSPTGSHGRDFDQCLSNPAGAPPLDWFLIPTQPYPGQHYATWPQKLALPFIESMCPRQVCRECGEPRRRLTERTPEYAAERAAVGDFTTHATGSRDDGVGLHGSSRSKQLGDITSAQNITVGWSDCGHDNYRNGLVLDPFAGSGTTLQVATGCGRDAIGIDLDERNAELARERVGPMFFELVEPAA